MRKFFDDDSGQLILLACVAVVLSIVLIATYEYSTLGTGEKSINRENINAYYFYQSIRDRYINIYNDHDYDFGNAKNITFFEKELKEFALLHGYSIDFIHNGEVTKIIFIDEDLKIEEELQ